MRTCKAMSFLLNYDRLLLTGAVAAQLAQVYGALHEPRRLAEALPADVKQMASATRLADLLALNRLLRLQIAPHRVRSLFARRTDAKTPREALLARLGAVLAAGTPLDFSAAGLAHLATAVTGHAGSGPADPAAADALFHAYCAQRSSAEKISLALSYWLDLKFSDGFGGEEATSFVALALLLKDAGLAVFEAVSFFTLLAGARDEFNAAVAAESFNWAKGYAQTLDFLKLMLDLVSAAQAQFADFIAHYFDTLRANRGEVLETIILSFATEFTRADIIAAHPFASPSTINRVLTRLRDEGKIVAVGKGRGARWRKL